MDYEVYSRAMNNNVQRLNQEEDDMVIKAKMFNEYSKPEHYEQLKDNPNVYLYKGMDKKKSNLENEKKDAEVLASWGENVYILPDVLVLNGIKYNGLPDAIIGNYFVEFKNTETYSSGTIEERIGNGIKKSDIIFFYVENKMNYPFKDVVKIYRDAIEGKIDSKKDINPEGKIVIIYDGKSKENEVFKIKSGPSLPKNRNDIAQSNIQSETQNSQGEKYIFENVSFDKVLESAKSDTYFEASLADISKSKKKSKTKKNSSEILFQTADEDKNSIETRIKEVINTKPSITITSENSLELSKDSKEAKKQVFDYCKSIKEKKVVSNDNKVEYHIVNNSYKEILHHGISGIEDKDNPRIKYLSEEDKDYLLIATRVPEIIKNFKFLYETKNEKGKRNVEYFEYYGCLVNCRGTDYFVRSTVVEYPDGKHYYDHVITKNNKVARASTDNQSELFSYNLYKKDRRLSAKIQEEKEQQLEKSLTLKQVGDDEWTERAREIALNSTSIEDFFSKYRENVDFNGAELDDNNIRLLISDIFYDTRENVIDEDVDEYYYSEEDVEEDTVVDSFNVEAEENVMPDDWLNDTEEEAEDAETDTETDTETDVNTMPDDWLSDEEEETVQEVENLVFEVQKDVVDSELKESSLSNPKMIDKNTKPIEFASIIAKDKELRDKILKGTAGQEEIEDYIKRTLEVKERQLRLAKEKQAKEGVFAYKNTISKPYKDIKKYQEYKYYKIVQAIDYKELKKEINALKEKEGYHCIGGICSAGIYLYVLMGKEKVVNQGRLIRKFERRIDVIEFRNGKATHLYYGIEATAYAFHCSPELIKGLIYTGQPFPYENDIVTFDLAPNCKYHIEPKNTSDRKYAYKVCEDENKIKKERMEI